jgi:hypothetical protein
MTDQISNGILLGIGFSVGSEIIRFIKDNYFGQN